jgi:dienelactone hydrolase
MYHVNQCTIIPFLYPGCVDESRTTADDVIKEARALLTDWTLSHGHNNIVMGSSFGCSILLAVLSTTNIVSSRVILENPLTSLSEVAAWHTNNVVPESLIRWFIVPDNNWKLPPRIRCQDCDLLVLTSEADELVPSDMSTKIITKFEDTASSITHVVLQGANHGDAPSHPEYKKAINAFLS